MTSARRRYRSSLLTSLFVAVMGSALASCSASNDGGSVANGGTGGTSGTSSSASGELLVFTTRATFDGNLGGLAGANKKCQGLAEAAGLSGTFRAWLSDEKSDAIDSVPAGGPWKHVGSSGQIVFPTKASWGGFPKVPLDVDEYGQSITPERYVLYWTGTLLGGTRHADTCLGWTKDVPLADQGSMGEGQKTDTSWTESHAGTSACSESRALVCYQLP